LDKKSFSGQKNLEKNFFEKITPLPKYNLEDLTFPLRSTPNNLSIFYIFENNFEIFHLDVDGGQTESGSKFESDNSDSDQNHSSGYNSNGNPSHVSNEDLEEDQNETQIVQQINDLQVNFESQFYTFNFRF